jgi:hypothetical protein
VTFVTSRHKSIYPLKYPQLGVGMGPSFAKTEDQHSTQENKKIKREREKREGTKSILFRT